MSEQIEIGEDELHAFIDGHLSPARRAKIEAAMRKDPALAEKVGAFVSDMERLRQAYGAFETRPVPEEWLKQIERHTQPRRFFSPSAYAAVAAAVLIAFGAVLAYRALSPQGDTIVADALAARSASLRDSSIAASRRAPIPEASEAVSSALHMRLKAPDLSRMGYVLSAYRIYGGTPRSNAVELVYRKTNGQLFTLYLRRSSGSVRFDQFRLGRLRVCIWQDDVVGTVMAGAVSAPEMQRLASLAYTGLTS